jgi:hypothetical protein
MSTLRSLQRITLGYQAVLCLAAAGCRRDGTFEIKDTEGRAFAVTCTERGGCNVARQNSTGRSAEPALTLRTDGRVLGVCERDSPPITCRPLLCDSEEDCPVVDGVVRSCSRALCSEPSRSLSRVDVVMLCMAGTGVGSDQPLSRERYAAALASGESQSLPTGCRQP